MEKLLFQIQRHPALSHAQFAEHYLKRHAPLALECQPGIARLAVHPTEETDALLAKSWGRDARPSACDGITAMWLRRPEDAGDLRRLAASPEAAARLQQEAAGLISVAHGWLVDEVVQWDYERDWRDGETTPGVKVIYFGLRKQGLSRDDFVRRYRDGHGPLARIHHPGIWRYVQNFVVRAVTPGAPELDSIAELNFRSVRDFEERMYRDADSVQVIADDVASFLRPTLSLVTHETWIRS